MKFQNYLTNELLPTKNCAKKQIKFELFFLVLCWKNKQVLRGESDLFSLSLQKKI